MAITTAIAFTKDPEKAKSLLAAGAYAYGSVPLPKALPFLRQAEQIYYDLDNETLAVWSEARARSNPQQIILEYAFNTDSPPPSPHAAQVIVFSPDGNDIKVSAFKLK